MAKIEVDGIGSKKVKMKRKKLLCPIGPIFLSDMSDNIPKSYIFFYSIGIARFLFVPVAPTMRACAAPLPKYVFAIHDLKIINSNCLPGVCTWLSTDWCMVINDLLGVGCRNVGLCAESIKRCKIFLGKIVGSWETFWINIMLLCQIFIFVSYKT